MKPTIPEKLKLNQRILTDSQIKKAKEMLKGKSQRFVAGYFGVSRGTIVRHCVSGMKEYYIKKSREWDLKNKEKAQLRNAKQALRAYHIISDNYPEEMKEYRKQQKDKIGKTYFKNNQREFRERNPDYYKKFKKNREQPSS